MRTIFAGQSVHRNINGQLLNHLLRGSCFTEEVERGSPANDFSFIYSLACRMAGFSVFGEKKLLSATVGRLDQVSSVDQRRAPWC